MALTQDRLSAVVEAAKAYRKAGQRLASTIVNQSLSINATAGLSLETQLNAFKSAFSIISDAAIFLQLPTVHDALIASEDKHIALTRGRNLNEKLRQRRKRAQHSLRQYSSQNVAGEAGPSLAQILARQVDEEEDLIAQENAAEMDQVGLVEIPALPIIQQDLPKVLHLQSDHIRQAEFRNGFMATPRPPHYTEAEWRRLEAEVIAAAEEEARLDLEEATLKAFKQSTGG